MVGVLVVVAVWSLCLAAILKLRYEVTRSRLPSPYKWEPQFMAMMVWDDTSPPILNANAGLPARGCIHVEVTPGHEADVVDEILRTDLDMAREGL